MESRAEGVQVSGYEQPYIFRRALLVLVPISQEVPSSTQRQQCYAIQRQGGNSCALGLELLPKTTSPASSPPELHHPRASPFSLQHHSHTIRSISIPPTPNPAPSIPNPSILLPGVKPGGHRRQTLQARQHTILDLNKCRLAARGWPFRFHHNGGHGDARNQARGCMWIVGGAKGAGLMECNWAWRCARDFG